MNHVFKFGISSNSISLKMNLEILVLDIKISNGITCFVKE